MKKIKNKKGSISKLRVFLDIFFFVLMVLVLVPQSTGIALHEWLSFVIIIPFFLHLLLNWNWIVTNSKKLFSRKIKFDYVFNWLLYIVMLLVTVSGIVISEAALPSIGINFTITPFWTMLHNASATLIIVLLGIHLALHWKWIVATIKKLHLVADFHHTKQLLKIIKNQRLELFILLVVSVIISLGIWLLEFTNWAENINLNNVKNKVESSKKFPKQWLIYVLPLLKVSVFLCVPALITGLIVRLKKTKK